MRTLAIDLGTRRVGLALSDEDGKFATPYDVLNVSSTHEALAPIAGLIRQESIQRVVLGLPLNMDDSIGPAAKQAIAWSRELSGLTSVELLFVDERLSSFAAEQQLNERKRAGQRLTRGGKKKQLDALAAALFLQEFLDGKLASISPESPLLPKQQADGNGKNIVR